MTEQRRKTVLFTALAVVLGWSLWLVIDEDASDSVDADLVADVADSRKVQPPIKPVVRAAPASVFASSKPRVPLQATRVNLFPKQTWYIAPPPPPPSPPPPPPPPPQAPALPFTYMGRWVENGKNTYYLVRGNSSLSAQVGQVIDGVWRLEPISGTTMNFTYLPLNQTRSLRMGD